MLTDSKPYTFDRVVRLVFGVVFLVALIWLVRTVGEVLIPLAIAALLAYLMNPLVRFAQRWIKNRTAAVLVTVVVVLLVAMVLAAILLPMMAGEIVNFGRLLGRAVSEETPLKQWAAAHLPKSLADEVLAFRESREFHSFLESSEFESLMNGAQSISGLLVVGFKWILSRMWGVVSGVASLLAGLMGLTVILLYLVFLLIDYRIYEDNWKSYLPPKYRDGIVGFLGEFNAAMARYFRGQFMVAAIVGVLFAIGFQIIGLKLGLLLGFCVGVCNMVPYLQILALPPALLLAVVTAFESNGSVLGHLIGVVLVFVLVQTLQDSLITPRIMGKVTGLRPAVILFSVLFWGKLLGFLGLVVAIPLTCLGVAYYRQLLARQTRETPRVHVPNGADPNPPAP